MRICLSALVALIVLSGLGCQSSNTPPSQATASPQRAIILTGGNGGGTVVYLPSSDVANPIMLSTSGEAECPECKAAAVKYFTTGVLEPKCARCGATRTVVTGTPPNLGHN